MSSTIASNKNDMVEMFRFYSMGGEILTSGTETDTNVVKIHKWAIRIRACDKGKLFRNFAFYIKGFKAGRDGSKTYWVSSEIVEVKSKQLLMSRNSAYYLSGQIDSAQNLAEGFEPSFNEHFKDGFPDDWRKIMEVFGDYIIKKGASTQEISRQISAKIISRQMPHTKSLNFKKVDEEAKIHQWIEKDFANRNGKQKRKSDTKPNEAAAKRKPLGPISSSFKALNDTWTMEEMKELWSAFHSINPCSDDDWNKVMLLFGQNRPLEEVKEQAKLLNLNVQSKKSLSPGSDLVEKFKRLLPNGQLPRKGTLRREVLADEVLKVLYCQKNENEDSGIQIDDDSDDEIIFEAMTTPKNNIKLNDLYEKPMPSTPVQYSLLVNRGRRRNNSESSFEDVGDDFRTIKRSRQYKYPLKYRAENQNRRFSRNNKEIEDENNEIEDESNEFFKEEQIPSDEKLLL